MSKHARTQIRNTVVDLLKSIIEFKSAESARTFNVDNEEMPAAIVYTNEESSELLDNVLRSYKHDLQLTIECYAKGKNIDETLDDLSVLVELKMEEDNLFSPTTFFQLTETQLQYTNEGSNIYGVLILTYQITYWTADKDVTSLI